jgi:cell division protein FtsL
MPELARNIIPLALIAAALLFCSWVRSEIVNTGYECQHLSTKEESLLRARQRLMLEEETLSNPGRIDWVARKDLRMTPLRPNQLVTPELPDVKRGLADTMAMVDSEATKLASKDSIFVPAN